MNSFRQAWQDRRPVVILITILLALVAALICILVIQGFFGGPPAPAPDTPVAGTATPEVGATVEPSPTATRVVSGGPTSTPTRAPTATPTPEEEEVDEDDEEGVEDEEPATGGPTETEEAESPEEPQIANLIRNGSFEFGFEEDGVALNWSNFTNGGAVFLFGDEQWLPAIQQGAHAQRITVFEAHQPDRYSGIFQTVPVVPGETYRLTLRGQIRIREGSDQVGKQSYRMQLALDQSGGDDWQSVPADEWIELAWDEQFIDSADVEFQEYKTSVVPATDRLTIFLRTWNKWPDPGEVQYTLDGLSLVGPAPAEALIDQPLPDTGQGSPNFGLPTDARIWASLALLLLLVGGAAWRTYAARPQE
ncbi:MAG: hypothetical protein ACE5H9_05185 [Anaerolineae bacterium]